ncbi:MAG: hypothetical protein J6V73_09120, partial [Spirochaetaceae bacterium]|nr:hypothetical protein [Spirochaetaceae bacterium]
MDRYWRGRKREATVVAWKKYLIKQKLINNLVMKMKNIKKIIVLLFFLIELFLPIIILGIDFVINNHKIENKYWSYDLNNDGIFSETEMNEKGFIEAEQRYIGDGGRNSFFVILIS